MAIFGTLEVVREQVKDKKFNRAFEYLETVLKDGTIENKRLLTYSIDAFEKINLDKNNFGLEQVYYTKDRNKCFFESHRKYIDVQFILDGEEIIEVSDIKNLDVTFPYDENMDIIKYNDNVNASIVKLQKGDVAIFFQEDGHMPCIKLNKPGKVVKTVVKVAV